MFITFEGIEGAGKTTLVTAAAELLREKGRHVLVTREPGSTDIGARIRAILLDPASRALDPVAELLLYMADRVQHIRTVMQPALDRGSVVLCDRYFDATLAYQGYARGLDREMILRLHRQVTGNFLPDVTFLLDLPVETGLGRAWQAVESGGRSRAETRFEEEDLAFHRRVRQGYLEIARQAPDRFRVIDAARDEIAVREAVCRTLNEVMHGTAQ